MFNNKVIIVSVFSLIVVYAIFMLMDIQKTHSKTQKPSLLTSTLDIGTTTLYVKDITTMKKFYQEIVGLEQIKTEKDILVLGFERKGIISLIQKDTLPTAPQGSAGLYHNAIVYKSRGLLARTVDRILKQAPDSYSGTADHLVSEAFYFTDPEGNGLELYFDKDPSTWVWENDRIKMGSIYIDPVSYIKQYKDLQESSEKHMGHVHLKVGDIAQAKEFYVDTLGFDITSERNDALFISVDGYHHHFGMNTWESKGASKRPETLGLHSVEMKLASPEDLAKLKDRLSKKNIPLEEKNNTLQFSDPWGNILIMRN